MTVREKKRKRIKVIVTVIESAVSGYKTRQRQLTSDGKMRGVRREVGIVRGERARIRARNGVICEAAVG